MTKEEKFAALGFVQSTRRGYYGRWVVPDGYIVVTEEGPAEEYLPGFYRRPDGLRYRDGVVSAVMADDEGYGQRLTITGIAKRPEEPKAKTSWRDGLTAEEIAGRAMDDEAQE